MRKREYIVPIRLPYTRIRSVIEIENGAVLSFVVQLEYNVAHSPSTLERWNGVARFDHNPKSAEGHDIRTESLHMDIANPNGPDQRAWGFPDVPVNRAVDFCEQYFRANHERLTKQFCKQWGFERWNLPNRR